ncbi:MAG: DUF3365 domain-containing protein [Gammaproteobacteria bacterium]|nr:DUF3365 domain-containing protein [Gammaproteobacteria bacterium]
MPLTAWRVLARSGTRGFALCLALGVAMDAGSADDGIPRRQVADMLYEMAFANRKVYTRDVVQRLTLEEDVLTASERYLDEKGLPLPAQIFRLGAEEILDNTDDFWIALRSLDPINFANGPITPVEEQGLQAVAEDPSKPFYAEEKGLTGRPSLVAVYADVASVEACVSCHNGHPKSPKRDFELGDVMGGVIIRLFLD